MNISADIIFFMTEKVIHSTLYMQQDSELLWLFSDGPVVQLFVDRTPVKITIYSIVQTFTFWSKFHTKHT